MKWSQEIINQVYEQAAKKAMVDEEFRKRLLAEPDAAIEEMTGQKLPEGFRFKVVESDPAYNATFVIPDLLSEEILEEELGTVAGGVSILVVATACAAAISLDIGVCPADACAANVNVK